MKTTDRSLSNSSNSFNTRGKQARSFLQEGALVPLFTPRQTGKKLVSTPLEDKCIQNRNKQEPYTGVHLQQPNNILTNSSESNPYSLIKFLHSRLSSLAGLSSFQFKWEVFTKNWVSYSSVRFSSWWLAQRGESMRLLESRTRAPKYDRWKFTLVTSGLRSCI